MYSTWRQPRCYGIFTADFTPTCDSASMARWLPIEAADVGAGPDDWLARHVPFFSDCGSAKCWEGAGAGAGRGAGVGAERGCS
jgi:hypothetical protein